MDGWPNEQREFARKFYFMSHLALVLLDGREQLVELCRLYREVIQRAAVELGLSSSFFGHSIPQLLLRYNTVIAL